MYNNKMKSAKGNLGIKVVSIFLSFLVVMILALPMVSMAQTAVAPSDPNAGKLVNPIPKITSIPGLIHTILVAAIKICIPIIALAIIYCGFLFVEARGNSEKIEKAKDALLYTVIGSAILLGSWAIAQLISETITGLG